MTTIRRVQSAIAATAVSAILAGCGTAGPLDQSLSEAQRSQLDRAWTARLQATDPSELPVAERGARVRELYAACAPLDAASPFLTSVKSTCKPVAVAAKLGAVLPERCATPAASCVRALDRIAETTDLLASGLRDLNVQARVLTTDPRCRGEFITTDAEFGAYRDLSAAYRVLALGIEQKDQDIAALGQHRIDDARAVLRPAGTSTTRTAAFRAACGTSPGRGG